MADSLFDNRYRYDYIYPRGRSGETLRAVDIQEGDRAVVIKRPAPHDAPPIRSGQEVSIVNERKALQRLAGHPALAELVGGGQFFVSGVSHQYIVIERAVGALVADMVREQAARGDRLPELELLVIVDKLLDLLIAAHSRDIIYNDVDAKHLFWDRENYRLKVIDWGNAVFLEGDEVTPQGISRQSDIFQVGELLYALLTGGQRSDVPRDAGEDFRLNFGDDDSRIDPRLQGIVSRALHPNPRFRYRTLVDLRRDLSEYRAPLEKERTAALARVAEMLSVERSKNELNELVNLLEPVLLMDPGYPEARQAFTRIEDRMSDLEVAGDLDAARIYLESGSWARGVQLLDELRGRTRGDTAVQVKILRDWARMLDSMALTPPPMAVLDAISLVFDADYEGAAQALLLQETTDERFRALTWLLAERVAAHVSDVILLYPNLYRIQVTLEDLAKEGHPIGPARTLMAEMMTGLDGLLSAPGAKKGRKKAPKVTAVNLAQLRDRFRALVDQLAQLGLVLEGSSAADALAKRLPGGVLERASSAAMALADHMHVIGKQAVNSPRDARAALESSRLIDPGSPAWDLVKKLLDDLYEVLQSCQIYIPAADGSDLAEWLVSTKEDLTPFQERLFDDLLNSMIAGLERASLHWSYYADAAVMGGRTAAVQALTEAIEAVTTLSPTLAGWLNQLRSVVQGAGYVERYALHGALGRALADGWEHFDRGRLPEAERLAGQAYEAARRDVEQEAARRLRDLAEAVRAWAERGGVSDLKRTQAAQNVVENLFTAEERAARQQFTAQMPNREVYLRAMGRGLVENFGRSSSASVRLLFVGYLLQGVLDAHADSLESTAFWREAALKTVPDAARHPLTRALDEFVERRTDLIEAASVINAIESPAALPTLELTRKSLEDNRQSKLLAPAVYSLRELEAAARDWADGEFRAAGNKLDNAIKALDDLETNAGITLTHYRAWLMTLVAGAGEMHALLRKLNAAVEARPETPEDSLRLTHRALVSTTERLLGNGYSANLRQWRDMYEQFAAAFTDRSARRSAKLTQFNDLFRALFIDRHPAYPLYHHWYTLVDAAPEFPAPPTDDPLPRLNADEPLPERITLTAPEPIETPVAAPPTRRRGLRTIHYVILGLIGGLIGGTYAILSSGVLSEIELTPSVTVEAAVLSPTVEASALPSLTFTPMPSATPVAVLATLPPLPTQTPSITPTPPPSSTPTPRPTATPSPTAPPSATPLPPEGVRGVQDLLALAAGATGASTELFALAEDGVSWRLGTGAATNGTTAAIALPLPVLEARYGNNAASRILSVEAELRLVTYNPALLLDNAVYFGLTLQNAANPNEGVGLRVDLADVGVVNIAQLQGDETSFVTQQSLGEVRLRLRLDRSPESGAVTTFVDGQPVGLPLTLNSALGVLPALFVKDGGVVVYVERWTVALR